MAWVARNFLIALACAAAGFVIVALAGAVGLRASGQDPIEIGEYVFTLVLFGWLAWPLYMGALYLLARRGRFRLWALVLCPLLAIALTIGNLGLDVPEVQATDVACVLFALVVRPRVPRGTGTQSRPEVESAASWSRRVNAMSCQRARSAGSDDGGVHGDAARRRRRHRRAGGQRHRRRDRRARHGRGVPDRRPGLRVGRRRDHQRERAAEPARRPRGAGQRLRRRDRGPRRAGAGRDRPRRPRHGARADRAARVLPRAVRVRPARPDAGGPRHAERLRVRRPDRPGHDPGGRRRHEPPLLPGPARARPGHPRDGPVHPRARTPARSRATAATSRTRCATPTSRRRTRA